MLIYIKIDNSSSEKRGTVNIFGNNLNKSNFYSGGNLEQIEFRECSQSFGAESCVFQSVTQKFKD